MKKAIIWDLDGTLLDSYSVIVESLRLTIGEAGVIVPFHDIWQHTITDSVSSFLKKISEEHAISLEHLKQRYSQISGSKYLEIKTMKNAMEVLEMLRENSVDNFVFTHRGKTTIPVLDNLGMTGYFKEILTSQSGFARKPAPDGIYYLIERNDLDREHTYYVGDRSLDMECAQNAGIDGILFLPEGSIDVSGGSETYIVKDLMDIFSII